MDLERAMEFMLEQQAQMQAQQAQADKEHKERMAELEKWLIRGAKMLAIQREAGQEADRRISALVEAQQANEQATRETDRRISALVEAQQATELRVQKLHDSHLATEQGLREMQASLKAFIDSIRQSGNGH